MAGRASVRGLDTIVNNLNAIAPRVREHLRKAAGAATNILHQTTVNNCALACHSLADLAAEGHPYSTRYPANYLHEDSLLHIQSGWLISNIEKVSQVTTEKVIVAVGVDEAKVNYIGWLIDGTWKMRSRDFLGRSFAEEGRNVVITLKFGLVEGLGSRGGTRKWTR